MKCKVDGCYARTFNKNLCRAHYYVWVDQLQTTAPRLTEREVLRATPAPPTPFSPVCTCEMPVFGVINMFGWGSKRYHDREPQPGDPVECRQCGKPIREFVS